MSTLAQSDRPLLFKRPVDPIEERLTRLFPEPVLFEVNERLTDPALFPSGPMHRFRMADGPLQQQRAIDRAAELAALRNRHAAEADDPGRDLAPDVDPDFDAATFLAQRFADLPESVRASAAGGKYDSARNIEHLAEMVMADLEAARIQSQLTPDEQREAAALSQSGPPVQLPADPELRQAVIDALDAVRGPRAADAADAIDADREASEAVGAILRAAEGGENPVEDMRRVAQAAVRAGVDQEFAASMIGREPRLLMGTVADVQRQQFYEAMRAGATLEELAQLPLSTDQSEAIVGVFDPTPILDEIERHSRARIAANDPINTRIREARNRLVAAIGEQAQQPSAERGAAAEAGVRLLRGLAAVRRTAFASLIMPIAKLQRVMTGEPWNPAIEAALLEEAAGLNERLAELPPTQYQNIIAQGIFAGIESAPQFSTQIAAAALPGGAIMRVAAFTATGVAPVFGQTLQQAYAETGDLDRATEEAAIAATITAATNVVPGYAIVGRSAQRAIATSVLNRGLLGVASRIITGGGAEAFQEMTEQIGQEVLAHYYRGQPIEWRQIPVAGIAGALLGGAGRGLIEVRFRGQIAEAERQVRFESQTERIRAIQERAIQQYGPTAAAAVMDAEMVLARLAEQGTTLEALQGMSADEVLRRVADAQESLLADLKPPVIEVSQGAKQREDVQSVQGEPEEAEAADVPAVPRGEPEGVSKADDQGGPGRVGKAEGDRGEGVNRGTPGQTVEELAPPTPEQVEKIRELRQTLGISLAEARRRVQNPSQPQDDYAGRANARGLPEGSYAFAPGLPAVARPVRSGSGWAVVEGLDGFPEARENGEPLSWAEAVAESDRRNLEANGLDPATDMTALVDGRRTVNAVKAPAKAEAIPAPAPRSPVHTNFASLGPGHAKIAAALDALVAEGTVRPASADLFMVVLQGASDEYLERHEIVSGLPRYTPKARRAADPDKPFEPWEMTRAEFLNPSTFVNSSRPQTSGASVSGVHEHLGGHAFLIKTPDGSKVQAYTGNRDMPGGPSVLAQGEIFYVESKTQKQGTGASLVRDALRIMSDNGATHVIMRVPHKDTGGPFIRSLVRQGLIGEAVETSEATGTTLHPIQVSSSEGTNRRNVATHRSLIQEALAAGKPVPVEVLRDYPELMNFAARNRAGHTLINKSRVKIAIARGLAQRVPEAGPADIQDASVLLEEYFHAGEQLLLSSKERADLRAEYAKRDAKQWAAYFLDGIAGGDKGAAEYAAGTFEEWFAHLGVEHALGRRLPVSPEAQGIIARLVQALRDAIKRLADRGYMPSHIIETLDRVLAGIPAQVTSQEATDGTETQQEVEQAESGEPARPEDQPSPAASTGRKRIIKAQFERITNIEELAKVAGEDPLTQMHAMIRSNADDPDFSGIEEFGITPDRAKTYTPAERMRITNAGIAVNDNYKVLEDRFGSDAVDKIIDAVIGGIEGQRRAIYDSMMREPGPWGGHQVLGAFILSRWSQWADVERKTGRGPAKVLQEGEKRPRRRNPSSDLREMLDPAKLVNGNSFQLFGENFYVVHDAETGELALDGDAIRVLMPLSHFVDAGTLIPADIGTFDEAFDDADVAAQAEATPEPEALPQAPLIDEFAGDDVAPFGRGLFDASEELAASGPNFNLFMPPKAFEASVAISRSDMSNSEKADVRSRIEENAGDEDVVEQIVEDSRPEAPEPITLSPEQLLRAKGIEVTQKTITGGRTVHSVSGNTYAIKDTLKKLGGSWYKKDKTWTFWNGDPTEAIAAALSERGVGPDKSKPSAGRRGDEDVAIKDARDRELNRPDERPTGDAAAGAVQLSTADLIRLGAKAGIPEQVLNSQIEDIGLIRSAFEAGRPMFLIGSAPGSGKTYIIAGSIRELRNAGAKRFMWVTMNQTLIEQIRSDVAAYGLEGVEFVTYSDLSANKDGLDTTDAVLILDEAHNVKNETLRGATAAKMVRGAKFTVLSSATPFENPVQARYLEPTGIFDGVGGHTQWAILFGAQTREIKGPRGEKVVIPYWLPSKESAELAKGARRWFEKQGVLSQRPLTLPSGMVQASFERYSATEEFVALYDRIQQAYDAAERVWRDPDGNAIDPKTASLIAMHRTNATKRVLEAAKTLEVIRRVRELRESGRKVVVFVETKADRELGRFRRSRDTRGPRYAYPQINQIMAEWAMERDMARAAGDSYPPRPFSEAIVTIAHAMYVHQLADTSLPSVTDDIMQAIPDAFLFTGEVSDAQARANLAAWRQTKDGVLLATMAKGGTGLSLHDKIGDFPTAMIVLNMPWSATQLEQVSGRINRYGLASRSENYFAFAENIPFESMLARRIGGRLRSMNATVKGLGSVAADALEDFDFESGFGAESMLLAEEQKKVEGEAPAEREIDDFTRAEAMDKTRRQEPDKDMDFFATPYVLSVLMAKALGPRGRVLEPSVGEGNLLRFLPAGTMVDAIEPHSQRRAIATGVAQVVGLNAVLHDGTFEDWAPPAGGYDGVIMNPPFSRIKGKGWQDITHVRKAFEMLSPNGRLVAIMSEGPFFRDDAQSSEFRDWLDERDATIIRLPEGAFSESGTGVRARIVVIDRQGGGAGVLTLDSMEAEEVRTIADDIPLRPDATEAFGRDLPGQQGFYGQGDVSSMTGAQGSLFAPSTAAPVAAQDTGPLPFSLKPTDMQAASAFSDGVPSPAFAYGVKQYLGGFEQAHRTRDMTDAEYRQAVDGYAASRAGASPMQRQGAAFLAGQVDGDAETGMLFGRAFHGSPYTFERFSTEKIGSGEGAQAYGFGLYFAGKREVAEFYRSSVGGNMGLGLDVLREYFKPGNIVPSYAGMDRVIAFYGNDATGGWSVEVIKVEKRGDEWVDMPSERVRRHFTEPTRADAEKVLGRSLSRLYEVELAPQEDEYLLWDRPLSEQSEKVKKALVDAGLWDGKRVFDTSTESGSFTGESLYRRLSEVEAVRLGGVDYWRQTGDPAASQLLHSLGIRGIKYLDATSRDRDRFAVILRDGTEYGRYINLEVAQEIIDERNLHGARIEERGDSYNYVIFSDADVQITQMFGRALPQTDPKQLMSSMEAEFPGLTLEINERDLQGRKVWELASIVVPKEQRKSGIGSEVMQRVVASADAAGATITLDPSTNFGATSVDRLRRFYSRFGFRRNRGRYADLSLSGAMFRNPKQPMFARSLDDVLQPPRKGPPPRPALGQEPPPPERPRIKINPDDYRIARRHDITPQTAVGRATQAPLIRIQMGVGRVVENFIDHRPIPSTTLAFSPNAAITAVGNILDHIGILRGAGTGGVYSGSRAFTEMEYLRQWNARAQEIRDRLDGRITAEIGQSASTRGILETLGWQGMRQAARRVRQYTGIPWQRIQRAEREVKQLERRRAELTSIDKKNRSAKQQAELDELPFKIDQQRALIASLTEQFDRELTTALPEGMTGDEVRKGIEKAFADFSREAEQLAKRELAQSEAAPLIRRYLGDAADYAVVNLNADYIDGAAGLDRILRLIYGVTEEQAASNAPFKPGQWVMAMDRRNYGQVVQINVGEQTAQVRWINKRKGTSAQRWMPWNELALARLEDTRPLAPGPGGAVEMKDSAYWRQGGVDRPPLNPDDPRDIQEIVRQINADRIAFKVDPETPFVNDILTDPAVRFDDLETRSYIAGQRRRAIDDFFLDTAKRELGLWDTPIDTWEALLRTIELAGEEVGLDPSDARQRAINAAGVMTLRNMIDFILERQQTAAQDHTVVNAIIGGVVEGTKNYTVARSLRTAWLSVGTESSRLVARHVSRAGFRNALIDFTRALYGQLREMTPIGRRRFRDFWDGFLSTAGVSHSSRARELAGFDPVTRRRLQREDDMRATMSLTGWMLGGLPLAMTREAASLITTGRFAGGRRRVPFLRHFTLEEGSLAERRASLAMTNAHFMRMLPWLARIDRMLIAGTAKTPGEAIKTLRPPVHIDAHDYVEVKARISSQHLTRLAERQQRREGIGRIMGMDYFEGRSPETLAYKGYIDFVGRYVNSATPTPTTKPITMQEDRGAAMAARFLLMFRSWAMADATQAGRMALTQSQGRNFAVFTAQLGASVAIKFIRTMLYLGFGALAWQKWEELWDEDEIVQTVTDIIGYANLWGPSEAITQPLITAFSGDDWRREQLARGNIHPAAGAIEDLFRAALYTLPKTWNEGEFTPADVRRLRRVSVLPEAFPFMLWRTEFERSDLDDSESSNAKARALLQRR